MGIRALNGCKTTYQSTTSDRNLLAITTTGCGGDDVPAGHQQRQGDGLHRGCGSVRAHHSGAGTMWQFDATHNDVIVGQPALSNGHVTFTIPATAAILITF